MTGAEFVCVLAGGLLLGVTIGCRLRRHLTADWRTVADQWRDAASELAAQLDDVTEQRDDITHQRDSLRGVVNTWRDIDSLETTE